MDNRRTHRAARPGRARVWLVVMAVLPLVLGVVFFTWKFGFNEPKAEDALPPDSTTPLARSIRLVGVQAMGSDDLLDAEGKKVGEFMSLGADNPNTQGQFDRTFIFEHDRAGNEPLEFLGLATLHPAGMAMSMSSSQTAWAVDRGGKRLQLLHARFDDYFYEHSIFNSFKVPFDRVDVTLQFHHGPVGPCEVDFRGPFEVGKEYRDVGGGAFTIEFKPPAAGGERGGAFHFVAKQPFQHGNSGWCAVDRTGKRRPLMLGGSGNWGGAGATLDYSFPEPPLAEIARFVCGEIPQSRSFRNILVRYPGRSDDDWGPATRQVAAALGCQPGQVANWNFTPEQAARVAHLARGHFLAQRLADPLERVKYDSLPPERQRKLRETMLRWVREGPLGVRAKGVELGLAWVGAEFFPLAMDQLAQRDYTMRLETSLALGRRAKLGPAEVEQVKKLVLAEPEGYIRNNLKYCLERCPLPEAKRALSEIAAAAATRPAATAPKGE